jgi:hypothetical protein
MCHIKWIEISFSWAFKDNFFFMRKKKITFLKQHYFSVTLNGMVRLIGLIYTNPKEILIHVRVELFASGLSRKKDLVLMTFIAMIGINNY